MTESLLLRTLELEKWIDWTWLNNLELYNIMYNHTAAVSDEKDIIIPYEQSALLDQIYSQFNVINRIEGENGFEFKVSGKEERIEKMLSLLKRKCAKGGVSDTLK